MKSKSPLSHHLRRVGIISLFFGFIPFAWMPMAQAEDFPFDSNSSQTDEIEKGLSAKEGFKESDETSLSVNRLDLGGSLRHELNSIQLEDSPIEDFFYNPTTLSLYLDSALSGEVRGFFRGKFKYDGTVDPNLNTSTLPVTGMKRSSSQLDEMKIQFPIEKTLFVTLGVQKIKWGVGHFWNPTDFINSQRKDILETEDLRAGLNLLKLHLPLNDMNFYAVADLNNTNQTKHIGSALRMEVPFSSDLTTGEFSISEYSKRGAATRYGGDLSLALGSVDLILEASSSKEAKSSSLVAGISYDWQYSDEDILNLTLESYSNEAGAQKTSDYIGLVATNEFIPFQVAKSYHLISVYIPKPGRAQHSDLQVMAIINGVDQSHYARLGYTWTGMKDLSLSFFIGNRSGTEDSEMRLSKMTTDYSLRTNINF